MQEQVNAVNHNISSVSFHSIYKSLTHSWLEWFFSKSGNTSEAPSSSEANFFLLAHISVCVFFFFISLYLPLSSSLSQLLNPSQWNLNLFPTIAQTFSFSLCCLFNPPLPLSLLFPFLFFFLHPSLAEICHFLLSLVWSLADRAFDLLMKKKMLHSHFTGCSSWHQQSVCVVLHNSVLHLHLLSSASARFALRSSGAVRDVK